MNDGAEGCSEAQGEAQDVRVLLPYPPSANLYWRVFRGRAVKSQWARSYQVEVKQMLFGMDLQPMSGYVGIESVLRPKMTRSFTAHKRVIDLDNHLKVVIDALEGILFADDKQVVKIDTRYGDPIKDGGVDLRIYKYEGKLPWD